MKKQKNNSKDLVNKKSPQLEMVDLTEDKEFVLEDNPRLHVSFLEEQLEDSQKKYLLLLSDFENYKKRVVKEKEDLVTATKVKMLQSILDMDNDLSYARKSSSELGHGVKLIINKLDNFLKSQGIETIQTEKYDEELHEVLSIIQSDEEKIVDVVSKGYTLNGKPFRYPKIILGRNA
jgi:molecular chaperone GrpE